MSAIVDLSLHRPCECPLCIAAGYTKAAAPLPTARPLAELVNEALDWDADATAAKLRKKNTALYRQIVHAYFDNDDRLIGQAIYDDEPQINEAFRSGDLLDLGMIVAAAMDTFVGKPWRPHERAPLDRLLSTVREEREIARAESTEPCPDYAEE